MVELVFNVSKKNPKLASPIKGIRCECGHVNPWYAKFCLMCGKNLQNELRKKYDEIINEIYEDIKKADPEKDYVDLDDI